MALVSTFFIHSANNPEGFFSLITTGIVRCYYISAAVLTLSDLLFYSYQNKRLGFIIILRLGLFMDSCVFNITVTWIV